MEKRLDNLRVEKKELILIQDILKKTIPDYDVAAFGSRTRTDAVLKNGSDIDLVIMDQDKPLKLKNFALLCHLFEEAPLPMKVDLSLWSEMTPKFQNLIMPDLIFIQKKMVSPLK